MRKDLSLRYYPSDYACQVRIRDLRVARLAAPGTNGSFPRRFAATARGLGVRRTCARTSLETRPCGKVARSRHLIEKLRWPHSRHSCRWCSPQHGSERARSKPWPSYRRRTGLGRRTASTARRVRSDVDTLGDAQRVFKFNAEISHRAVDLGVTKEQLDRAEIAGLPVDLGSLRPAKRMRAVPAGFKADG